VGNNKTGPDPPPAGEGPDQERVESQGNEEEKWQQHHFSQGEVDGGLKAIAVRLA